MAIAVAVMIIIGSFFLPNVVAQFTDLRRIDNLVFADSQRLSFDAADELTLVERIALAGSANTEILPMITGNALDHEAARDRAALEIIRFFYGGTFEFVFDEKSVSEGFASLVIDIRQPNRYMIVWEFDITDPYGNSVTVIIDDEVGVIVRLIYRMADRDGAMITYRPSAPVDEQFYLVASHLANLMADYYGMTVTLADYQFSGTLSYYRADILSGGLVIPMFGVVRTASFTMNERV